MDKTLSDIYTDYLISSFGPVTATGLARLLDDAISHDQVTRFLASTPKTSADLWSQVKPLLRQVESEDGVVIMTSSTTRFFRLFRMPARRRSQALKARAIQSGAIGQPPSSSSTGDAACRLARP